jgi:hypothetical protein
MTQHQEVRQPFVLRLLTPLLGWLVRFNIGPLGRRMMVIFSPGAARGRQYSVPIGYLRVEDDFIAVDAGGNSEWYRNLQAMPELRLHAQGGPYRVRVDFVSDPDEVAKLLDGYKVLYAGRYERFLGVPYDMPSFQAARSPNLRASFIRFHPVQA